MSVRSSVSNALEDIKNLKIHFTNRHLIYKQTFIIRMSISELYKVLWGELPYIWIVVNVISWLLIQIDIYIIRYNWPIDMNSITLIILNALMPKFLTKAIIATFFKSPQLKSSNYPSPSTRPSLQIFPFPFSSLIKKSGSFSCLLS